MTKKETDEHAREAAAEERVRYTHQHRTDTGSFDYPLSENEVNPVVGAADRIGGMEVLFDLVRDNEEQRTNPAYPHWSQLYEVIEREVPKDQNSQPQMTSK